MSLPDGDTATIRELFEGLEQEVCVRLELGPAEEHVTLLAGGGRELDPAELTRALLTDVCDLSDRVTLEIVEHAGRGSYPRTTVGPRIAYVGVPWGYELTSLVHGIVEAGRRSSSLGARSLERLAAIEREVAIEVFVTPTCPNCPPAVLLAYRCAAASPHIRAEAVETSEFPSRAGRLGVHGVPAVVVDGRPAWAGRVPEDVFVDRLLEAAALEDAPGLRPTPVRSRTSRL